MATAGLVYILLPKRMVGQTKVFKNDETVRVKFFTRRKRTPSKYMLYSCNFHSLSHSHQCVCVCAMIRRHKFGFRFSCVRQVKSATASSASVLVCANMNIFFFVDSDKDVDKICTFWFRHLGCHIKYTTHTAHTIHNGVYAKVTAAIAIKKE